MPGTSIGDMEMLPPKVFYSATTRNSQRLYDLFGMKSIIVGTAGHIDHGKTALVKALTGIDADRLAEEKRRGITIDLGFAHLELKTRNGEGIRIGIRRRAGARALCAQHAGGGGRYQPGAAGDRRR